MPNACSYVYESVSDIKYIQLNLPFQVTQDLEMTSCDTCDKVCDNEDIHDTAVPFYENVN